MYFSLPSYSNKLWNDYALIMPAIAVGNVGQLTVDLLLATLEVELIGRIHTPNILPLVGADPFDLESKRLTTSCQVYACTKHKLIILQQRTSITRNGRQPFRQQLVEWIKQQNFKYTICLSSCFDNYLTGNELSDKLNFLCTPELESSMGLQLKEQMGWTLLKRKSVITLADNAEDFEMPGSGITKSLYHEFIKQNVSLVVLVWYCSEGDNIPDALGLVEQLNQWLHLWQNDSSSTNTWKRPVSWNLLFGNEMPSGIY